MSLKVDTSAVLAIDNDIGPSKPSEDVSPTEKAEIFNGRVSPFFPVFMIPVCGCG